MAKEKGSGRQPKVKPHPALAVVTKIIGGREKIARAFLDQLFKQGYHIAKNAKRAPRAA